jgi:hypothetical protein
VDGNIDTPGFVSPRAKSVWVLSILGVGIILWYSVFGFRITRTEIIRRDVERNLRTGSTLDEVVHYLDGRHLEHSGLIRPEAMFIDGRKYDGQLVVVAIKRHTFSSLLIEGGIQLVFTFDENHRLNRG